MFLAEIQCEIDLYMMDGYNFSRIMMTFFTTTSPLRMPAPLSKAYVGDNGSMLYLSFQFQFVLKHFNLSGSVNEIVAFIQNFVALTFTTPRNASERTFLHSAECMDTSRHFLFIYGTSFVHFMGRKNC